MHAHQTNMERQRTSKSEVAERIHPNNLFGLGHIKGDRREIKCK